MNLSSLSKIHTSMKKIIALVSTLGCICLIGANIIFLQKAPRSTCIISHRLGGRNGGIFVQYQGI